MGTSESICVGFVSHVQCVDDDKEVVVWELLEVRVLALYPMFPMWFPVLGLHARGKNLLLACCKRQVNGGWCVSVVESTAYSVKNSILLQLWVQFAG